MKRIVVILLLMVNSVFAHDNGDFMLNIVIDKVGI